MLIAQIEPLPLSPMPRSATRVLLVRHGATTSTEEDRFSGSADIPLSNVGREQARRLAERLRREELAGVYSSDLDRAVETAKILAEPHGLPVEQRGEFREISHGRWEGMTREEVLDRYPKESAAWDDDPFSYAPEGGETGLAVTARALPALLELVTSHPGERILVVSHKATIRLVLSSLLGFDPRRYRDNLDQMPAALNIVDFREPTRARLTLFNDTSHYAGPDAAIPPIPGARLSKWWDDIDD